MKSVVKIAFIGIIVALIILVVDLVYSYLSGREIILENLLLYFGYNLMYALPLSTVNAYFFDYTNFKVEWVRYGKYRYGIGFIGSVIITLVTFFFIRLFHNMVLNGETFEQFLATEKMETYITATFITLIAALFFHALYFYKALQDKKVKEQKVIANTASAQFDALKNQLDPHFLFNSLNVLTSLIEEDTGAAQDFTTALSKVYRYVLEQKNKELVSVDEELDFARTYVQLLKMRFEDSIQFHLPEQSSDSEAKVVPLSLQLLLENAVKHNIVTAKKPLHIYIEEADGYLTIKNNLQRKQTISDRKGVGLANIVQRYDLLTDRTVKIVETEQEFVVKLPMLTKKLREMTSIETTDANRNMDERYIRARKKIEDLKGFYYNLLSYALVIPFLAFINYQTYWGFKWFFFPMAGWGLGILFHAYGTFVNDGFLGKNWEERQIEKYMREEENLGNKWK
ncbi:MAG: 2TM domain-containing protein [Flavobacteriaceae bacterium]|nr:2TM domain-containing protein [Flavobacteriaceae bacterium]